LTVSLKVSPRLIIETFRDRRRVQAALRTSMPAKDVNVSPLAWDGRPPSPTDEATQVDRGARRGGGGVGCVGRVGWKESQRTRRVRLHLVTRAVNCPCVGRQENWTVTR